MERQSWFQLLVSILPKKSMFQEVELPHQHQAALDLFLMSSLKFLRHRGLGTVLLLTVATLGIADAALALQRGARGTQVLMLQRQLKASGYYGGSLTGRYDLATEQAVSQFQQRVGIPETGIADDATLAMLRASGKPVDSRLLIDGRTGGRLARGSYGPEVKVLQNQLVAACYSESPANNNYDQLTEVAVRRVQNSQGVFRDGAVGPETRLALKRQLNAIQLEQAKDYEVDDGEYSGARVLRQGSRGKEVAVLQQQLKVAGYFSGEATGCYDNSTRKAVQRFQRTHELPEDGILSSTTRTVLKRELNRLQVAASSKSPAIERTAISAPSITPVPNIAPVPRTNPNAADYPVPTYAVPDSSSSGGVAPASTPASYNFSAPAPSTSSAAPTQASQAPAAPLTMPGYVNPNQAIPSYSVPTYRVPSAPAQ